mgnify:CR=1 FL=1|tara:strand:- start:910 stop:10380 length:9471 start_codon:yes stop_codon:yes gene_type:complete
MEVYIVDGRELTLEQFEALAKEAGLSTEKYKALYNVEVKQDPNALDAAAGEDKASWESQLANLRSEYRKTWGDKFWMPEDTPDVTSGRGEMRKREVKRIEFTKAEKELVNKIKSYNENPNNIDFADWQTVINQGEDAIKSYLAQEFPFLRAKDGTIGNAIKVQLANGEFKEIDLKPIFSGQKKQAIEVIKEINATKEEYNNREIIQANMNNLAGSIERSGNVNAVNALLKDNTPYQLEQITEKYDEFAASDIKSYNVYKNGELISTQLPITKVDDFLRENITKVEFDNMVTTSVKAIDEMAALQRAYIERESQVIEEKPETKVKYYKKNYQNDVLDLVKSLGDFSQEELDEIEAYITRTQRQQFPTGTLTSRGYIPNTNTGLSPDEIIRQLTSLEGLSADIKNKLVQRGFINEMKEKVSNGISNIALQEAKEGSKTLLQNALTDIDKNYLLDLANYHNDNTLNKRKKINLENLGGLENDDTKELLTIAGSIKGTDLVLRKRNFEKDNKNAVKAWEDFYNPKLETIQKEFANLLNQLPPTVSVESSETPSGPLFKIDSTKDLGDTENKRVNNLINKITALQSTYHNLVFDANKSKEKIINNYSAFNAQLAEYTKSDYIIDEANKEYGLFNLVTKDVNDAFSQLFLTVPTLLNSDWAIRREKQLKDKNNYYKEMVDPEFSLEYITRTLGQQSANITMAIGIAGLGSIPALGLSDIAISNAIGVSFGLSSGTQTFRDLSIQRDAAEEAKLLAVRYKEAFDAGEISEYNYTIAMRDINTTIAMGKLDDNQILNASIANGIIEGTLTKYIGTASNSIALVKNFTQVDRATIAKTLFQGNPTKFYEFIGKPLVTRTGLEVVEEELIFGGQQFVTEAGILGRDIDREKFLKGANDTFWATVVTAGMSQSTGIVYSGMNAYGITKKYEKVINKSKLVLNDISASIQNLAKGDEGTKNSLLLGMFEELKSMGLAIDQNSIDLLNLSKENKNGESDLKTLIGTQLVKQDYLRSLGIEGGTKAEQESALEAYKATLTEGQLKNLNDTLNAFDTQINNIKEKASKASNYDVAKEALGNIYTIYDESLKNDTEYKAANTQGKLVKIINALREDMRLQNIENAKSNPSIVEQVENMPFAPFTKEGAEQQRDKIYEKLGNEMALQESRGFSTQLNVNRQASLLIGGDLKSVNVVSYKNDEELKDRLEAVGLKKGSPDFMEAFNKLKQGKVFGLVFGKTIITQNEDAVKADLEAGVIRAGTVVLHELTHIIKDAQMKSPESKKKYFDNLFLAASTSNNLALKSIHDQTVNMMNRLYGDKEGENKLKWQDEYTIFLQEQLYAYEDFVQIETDDSFLTKIFNRTNPANLNTPEKALNYLAASNAAFRRGKISRSTKKAVERFEGTNIKESGRDINDLARDYKTLPVDQRASFLLDTDFYRQYLNTSLAAMGFNINKGDIATEQAEGFAVDAFDRVTKSYKPEDGSFTNWIYSTVGREGRAKIGEEIERKKKLVRQSQAQEQTRLVAKETAEDAVSLEERKKAEGTGRTLVDPRKLPGVPSNIDNIVEINKDDVVINPESRSYTTDFRSISDQYGPKVAGEIYGINPSKLKKGADLTYGQNKVVDGRKVSSEAEKIQSEFTNAQNVKKFISLFPEFNISTPTAVTTQQGQETKVDKDVQGRSLGIAPSVQNYFYENYVDPRSLNKETKKDAITNPKGRSKGTTSQTQVKRLKPEFRGTISNETIKKLQNDLGITAKGEFNVPPKGKARTEFGRLLIGLANLKGAIVANTVVDQKIQSLIKKGEIKSVRTPEQITASTRAGRSKIQYSEKAPSEYVVSLMQKLRVLNKESGTKKATREGEFLTRGIQQTRLSDGTEKTIIDRDKYLSDEVAAFKGEMFLEGMTRVINDFLKTYPEFRNFFKQATVFGMDRSAFGVAPLYNKNISTTKSKQANVNRESMTSNKKLTNAYVNEIENNTKSYVAKQKDKIQVLYDFAKAVESYLEQETEVEIDGKIKKVKANKKNAWVFDEIRAEATNSQQSPFRTLFPVYLVEVDFQGKPLRNVKGTEEHSTPQNQIGTLLIQAAIDQKVDEVFPIVKALAMQGWLSDDVDNKLNEDYSKSMPYNLLKTGIELYNKGELKLPDGTLAAIRMSESDVDLSFQMYIPTGQTLSQIFFGTEDVKLVDQKQLMRDLFSGKRTQAEVKQEAKRLVKIQQKVDETFKPEAPVAIDRNNTADKAMADARNSVKYKESRKGISVFDFDDTLAQSNSKVLYTMPDGTTGSLTAGEFALEASGLTELGAEFDFSEFNEVKEGRKGPLADLALRRQEKFGSQDIFVLTARPQASAINIKQFLDEIGLNIPLANITGLADGRPEAKANWMIEKYADGYNDFYFADDAFKNVEAVQNVFDVLDVKSKVQQARVKFSEKLDKDFNDMIERNMGVPSEATYSDIVARRMGKNQKRFAFFIPPSADDFRGLTMYTFAGKGKQGEADQEFFNKALIKPYMAGVNAMNLSKNRVKNAYKVLQQTSPEVRKKLNKKIGGTKYTHDAAIRIYLWSKDGTKIPGLSKRDQEQIVKLVEADTDLVAYAEGVKLITKQDVYLPPSEFWDGTTIIGDLSKLTKDVKREEYLKDFSRNVDIIFSPKNLNKVEAIYGFRVREALENIIYRMKTGSNRKAGADRIVTAWNDWTNRSVGAIMFFNRRSALLQMLSAGNFVNWSDNNPLKAAAAFANQPQYWKDVVYLFNSPKLKARRSGLEGDINEAEIAQASKKGGMEGVLSYLLKIGFTPTQIADSIAISTGGASFYRNRINTYKKQGYTTEDAEKKAFEDFSAISDETQQSADPMLISMQQAGTMGRLVLAFQNTPMQYTRLMKKAGQDIINGRGDFKTNFSKILYYGFIQNLIFSTLQNAMFALLPGFEDEEEPDFKTDKEKEEWLAKQDNKMDNKTTRVVNNMLDTLLRGSGLAGAVVATTKNVIMEYNDRQDMTILEKSRNNADLLIALSSISPPISSKLRKINNALNLEDFERDIIAERGFSVTIDGKFQLSPQYQVVGEVASGLFNLPLDRVFNEVNSITEALDERNSAYQRIALALGWKTWDVGAKIEEHELIKTLAKEKRKKEGIEKGKQTRKTNKELEKEHERLRRSIIFKLPKPIKDSLIKKEREDKKITAIYKLNQLKAKYLE